MRSYLCYLGVHTTAQVMVPMTRLPEQAGQASDKVPVRVSWTGYIAHTPSDAVYEALPST